MKSIYINRAVMTVVVTLALGTLCVAQNPFASNKTPLHYGNKTSQIKQKDVRAHMEFLASDAMQGRGSGTEFELLAGQYMASQMRQFGIEPAGDTDKAGNKTFIQTVNISRNSFAESPKLNYSANGSTVILEHGKQMIIFRMQTEKAGGGLQKVKAGEKPQAGKVALLREDGSQLNFGSLLDSGAAAVLIEENPQIRAGWNRFASREISFTNFAGSSGSGASTALIFIDKASAEKLSQVADETQIEIAGELGKPETRYTWNAIGMLQGSDPKLSSEVILLSAHMDHVGVNPGVPGDDKIFNGADDDASGCVAVLELARVMASGKRPKRTVYFTFYGSEEAGGFGARYFVNNLPFAKNKLIANLQFEMIGRPDAKVGKDELWLTGFDRSNLGSELAKNGAKLVNDPHPEQNFFRRSDNYTLAREGIIAHTVSSFGLHKDYHQPSDEIEKIDFDYMTGAINSMIGPVQWLTNSSFKPTWYEGKRP
jgi:hypothetical protein